MKILVCRIYFQQTFKEKEEKVNLEVDVDVKNFFEQICKYSKSERTYNINENIPVLLEIKKRMPNDKLGISFYKYRGDEKPYIEDEMGDLTLLDGTLVELTNTYLDDTEKILYVQYNYNGLKVKKIEEYLNKFIANEDLSLHIEPLYKDFTLNSIYNSSRIKNIYVKFKNTVFSYNRIEEKQKWSNSITSFIQSSEESIQDVLELSIKPKKGDSFDGKALRELIDSTEENTDIIDILVEYKNSNGELKKESINAIKEEIYFNILKQDKNKNKGWEYILDNIYIKSKEISISQTPIVYNYYNETLKYKPLEK